MPLKVLVGIITINRANIIPKAIQSAIDQDFKNLKIAVFDDGSTDGTKKLEAIFSQVDWCFSAHQGYIYGRNKLMRETDAEYYCSIDDDSWFIKGNELSIACKYLDEHPEVACVAFDILSPDRPTENQISAPVETNLFLGCGHVLRLSVAREAGFYIKYPGFYGGEERDLCIRLIDKGYKIVKLPGIHVWHEKSNLQRYPPKIWVSTVCNDLTYAYIRFPFIYLFIGLAHKTLLYLKLGARDKLILPTLKGIVDFIFFFVTFQLKRRPVSIKGFKKFRQLY